MREEFKRIMILEVNVWDKYLWCLEINKLLKINFQARGKKKYAIIGNPGDH